MDEDGLISPVIIEDVSEDEDNESLLERVVGWSFRK